MACVLRWGRVGKRGTLLLLARDASAAKAVKTRLSKYRHRGTNTMQGKRNGNERSSKTSGGIERQTGSRRRRRHRQPPRRVFVAAWKWHALREPSKLTTRQTSSAIRQGQLWRASRSSQPDTFPDRAGPGGPGGEGAPGPASPTGECTPVPMAPWSSATGHSVHSQQAQCRHCRRLLTSPRNRPHPVMGLLAIITTRVSTCASLALSNPPCARQLVYLLL